MMAYFAAVIADRRTGAADTSDVTASIINRDIEIDGQLRRLTDEELCNVFMLLLIAGLHTTQGSLAWGVMHLAAHPEQRAALVEDPRLIPAAVEEVLRVEAAVSPGRRVVHDTELGGVQLRGGDQMLVMLTGANREFILNRIPHISRLMVPGTEDVLGWAQTVVIGGSRVSMRCCMRRCNAPYRGMSFLDGAMIFLTS